MERYESYKDSGIDWIEEIPSHWTIKPCKAIWHIRKEIVNEAADPQELLSVSEYYGVAFRHDKIADDEPLMRAENLEGYQRAYPGDLIMNIMLAWKGSQGVAEVAGVTSPSYAVYEPDLRYIFPRYAHYLFRTDLYCSEFKRNSTGIIDSRLRLYPKVFLQTPFLLPSIEEQESIAAYLDEKTSEIDNLIVETERSIKLLEEYRKAITLEVVTKGLDSNALMKDSGVEWIGEMPQDWEVDSLARQMKLLTNGYVGPTWDLFHEDGVRYIQSLHVANRTLEFDKHPYYVSDEWSARHSRSILQEGDVLVVQTGAIGNVAYVDKEYEGCNCHALIILRPDASLVGKYLMYLLGSSRGKDAMLLTKTGATHPHLNATKICHIKIPVPAVEEQRKIVAYLDRINELIDERITYKRLLEDRLNEYRKSLISEAVTGKFKVPGVE